MLGDRLRAAVAAEEVASEERPAPGAMKKLHGIFPDSAPIAPMKGLVA